MSYLVTARKYRPQSFEELVGQEHISRTLQNAIRRGKIGHAYLFSGQRGVGKTSAARIFAKALNCEKGPTPNPCNKCRFCVEITEGKSLDLIEIDGASNRGITEIRNLQENVRFVPTSSRYKVYIIDEVHMLTTEAFNALLKTLEEPPEHVIFIFATTEVHKVPATIRSRCQQFVFRSIPMNLIVETLKKILSDLKIGWEDNALYWIARSATGSMRDAESMLDQVISYSEGDIKTEDVFEVLGLPPYAQYHRIVKAIARQDYLESFMVIDEMIKNGIEVNTIISGLIEYFRNLYLLLASRGDARYIDLPEEDVSLMNEISQNFSARDISNILLLLSRVFTDSRNSDVARYLFEISLIKISSYRDIIYPGEILKRLENLQKKVETVLTGELSGMPEINEGDGKIKRSEGESFLPEQGGSNVIDMVIRKEDEGESPAGAEEDDKGDSFLNRIVKALSFKRRALAEFLKNAYRHTSEGDKLRIFFNKSQKLAFEHLNDESNRRILEKEIGEILSKKVILEFVYEDKSGNAGEGEGDASAGVSPKVEKILQVFKGEIISNKEAGGS